MLLACLPTPYVVWQSQDILVPALALIDCHAVKMQRVYWPVDIRTTRFVCGLTGLTNCTSPQFSFFPFFSQAGPFKYPHYYTITVSPGWISRLSEFRYVPESTQCQESKSLINVNISLINVNIAEECHMDQLSTSLSHIIPTTSANTAFKLSSNDLTVFFSFGLSIWLTAINLTNNITFSSRE